MEPFAGDLIGALQADSDILERVLRPVMDGSPGMGPERYSTDDLQQLFNGFRALLTESLEERPRDVYTLYMETAIPGMIAEGQTPESLVEATTAFGTMLSMYLIEAVPQERREPARLWLARFFGEYVRRLSVAARSAEQGA